MESSVSLETHRIILKVIANCSSTTSTICNIHSKIVYCHIKSLTVKSYGLSGYYALQMENLWISCGGPANPSCHWSPGTWAITHPLKMVPCATLESHLTLSIFFNLNHTLLSANGNYFIRYVEEGRSRPGKSLTCCYFFHPQPAHLICLLPYTVLFEVQLSSFTSRALTKKNYAR
jgi:hypothetical protein